MGDWQELLRQIKIIGTPLTNTLEELEAYERSAKFKLPKDYHSYCQTFGGGCFNEIISIDRVTNALEDSSDHISEQTDFKDVMLLGNPDNNTLLNIAHFAYIFGLRTLGAGIFFVFDTSSYRDSDGCCDIYLIEEDAGRVNFLGRSFYEFIVNYCIGDNLRKDFPHRIFADPGFILPGEFYCDEYVYKKSEKFSFAI